MKYSLFLFLLFLSGSELYACSCANPGEIDEKQYSYYDFIAQGKISRMEETHQQLKFWLEVTDLYKGESAAEVMITTPLSSAACGLYVKKGDFWLIYAVKKEGVLNTNLCTRSLPLKSEGMTEMPERARQDLKFLEKKVGHQNTGEKQVYSIGVVDHLHSEKLNEERTLNIYLPHGYAKNDSVHYPVIYLLDGSTDEDFEHVAGLLQFCNFPWLNYMPKCIIVGIANTNRNRDLTFPSQDEAYKKKYPSTGGSAAFIDFIESELKPYIQSHYAANDSSMLIGQSLGGLLASEILYKKPEMFDHYFIVSPSLWYNHFSLLDEEPAFLQPDFHRRLTIYIAVGDEGHLMKKGARALNKQVSKSSDIESEFQYFKNEDHASILHLALYRGFKDFKK